MTRLFSFAVLLALAIPAITAAQTRAPSLITKVEVDCTSAANEARAHGTVVLGVTIDDKGIPGDFRVVRGLEYGLNDKALEAIAQWRFEPALKDGRPAAVNATVEMNLRCP